MTNTDWRSDIESASRRLGERAGHFLRETPLWKLPAAALGVAAPGAARPKAADGSFQSGVWRRKPPARSRSLREALSVSERQWVFSLFKRCVQEGECRRA